MLKNAAALLLICVSLGLFVSCGKTTSNFLYAAIPGSSQIDAYREDPNSGELTVLSVSPITAGPGVQSLVVHPSKKFLYAANSGENDVSLFTIASDGSLTEVTPRTPVATGPTLVVVDAAGSFLYVANSGSENISVFSIDATSGALSQVAGSPFQVGVTPLNMKIAPSGKFLYVTGSGTPTGVIETLAISSTDPACDSAMLCVIQVTQTQTNPYGLTIDPAGAFLYTANAAPDNAIGEFAIGSDGTLSELPGSPLGEAFTSPLAVLVDPSGKYLFVANEGSSNIAGYAVGSTGGLSLLSNSPFASNAQPVFLASDPAGRHIFVANQSSAAAVQTFELDGSSGTLASLNSASTGSTPTSIALTQ
jgi:6-phosphogluconolactonase